MELKIFILIFLAVRGEAQNKSDDNQEDFDPVGIPLLTEYPCHDSIDIVTWFDPGLPPREKNRYYVLMNRHFGAGFVLKLSFDSDVYVLHSLGGKNERFTKIFVSVDEELTLQFTTKSVGFGFIVKGVVPGTNPYFESISINDEEVCNQPNVGYLEEYIAETIDKGPHSICGRRTVDHTELIVNGASTKPGDWPWHAAIYRLERTALKYICGGTLISKNYIITAAHCASIRGVPVKTDFLNIVLGKYNLIGDDAEIQERLVHKIILHEKFDHKHLNNDIALLKLKSEVIFTDYVKPACLWFSKAVSYDDDTATAGTVFGTVVGWGFDNNNELSRQLRQAKMPMISENTCIKSRPLFYGNALNGNKFCAGYQNGTSACNGDSGSAFQVFVPDKIQDVNSNTTGAWYVRGIVSMTVSRRNVPICDPTKYVVFTDVEKYRPWIDAYLENERN
ncbi:unnamed protein product [Euphydryas editha]|uniref:Peptidase S1 domain-containing protein n=1 Tax=Euphydryas editha TaxID=104508 RepID=A0AAU9UI56_EUPED|nr:unnamed protein product [Euphydryas editha]